MRKTNGIQFHRNRLQSTNEKPSKMSINGKRDIRLRPSEASEIGRFIVEKILLPKIIKTNEIKKPKAKKIALKSKHENAIDNDTRPTRVNSIEKQHVEPKANKKEKKKKEIIKEASHKNQSTMTDDINAFQPEMKTTTAKAAAVTGAATTRRHGSDETVKTKRAVKKSTNAAMKKQQTTTIADRKSPNERPKNDAIDDEQRIAKIGNDTRTKSASIKPTATFDDLFISEVIIKFNRSN